MISYYLRQSLKLRTRKELWLAALLLAACPASAQFVSITEYPIPTPNSISYGIAAGPDGALWFTEGNANKIGRITTAGVFTEYPLSSQLSGAYLITVGPDGALWFTENTRIGRITTAGLITEYPLTGGGFRGIAAGPDSALWFAEGGGGKIGRITTAGAITEYLLPALSEPEDLTIGPDGALWFTEYGGNKIGRIANGGAINEYPIATANSGPHGITTGPDGALWFAEFNAGRIGRMTLAGVITEYPLPNAHSFPNGIIIGPDAALWFTEEGGGQIGRISTAGVITEYAVPVSGGRPYGITMGPDGALWFADDSGAIGRVSIASTPPPVNITEYHEPTVGGNSFFIASGPDGLLWFTEDDGNRIGRITTSGAFTEYGLPTASVPEGITNGPDAALWFTEQGGGQIGRISTAGVITEYPLPTPNASPLAIVAGPDGALWFTEFAGNKVGRISTAGFVTEYLVPTSDSQPYGIAPGPDGALWFTENAGNKVGRISTAGIVTEYPVPTTGGAPVSIAAGPDGALWFAEYQGNKIGRITTTGVISEFAIPTPASGPLAIASGLDGALWFTEREGNQIGRVTTAGVFTEYTVPTGASGPTSITRGPGGDLWFTEYLVRTIAHLSLATPVTGQPAVIAASGGTPQSATTGTAFPNALQAAVTDLAGNPVSGVIVTFHAPSTGAGAVLSTYTAVTNAVGLANVTATANSIAGSYAVIASVGDASALFSLTNTPSPDVGTNVALGMLATESSTLAGYPSAAASSAVDGITDGRFLDKSVTTTNPDVNAWWQVDLGAWATINSVVIWNRTDCCGSRLSDYWVFISNTPFSPADTPANLQFRAGTFSSHQTIAPNPSTAIPAGGAQGRYVRVQLTGADYLSLAEVQVLARTALPANLAQGKLASQSSTYPGAFTGPGAAVDGNTDGNFAHSSVSTTNFDQYAWWQVDLGTAVSVNSVTIWNRTDCCGSRLADYWVFVSDTPFSSSDTPASLQNRPGTFSSHQTSAPNPSTSINVGAQGRYLRVQLTGADYLSLAEVQVFGIAEGPSPDLAQGQIATQSSTLPGTASAAAGTAVDGFTDGAFYDGSVTATNSEANAWWQVDLAYLANVASVVVWNRTDCCASRLSDYWVFVSDTPFNPTDSPATLQNRPGTFSSHQTSAPNPSSAITVGAQGRYIRVQLTGTNYLSLAEVQVLVQ